MHILLEGMQLGAIQNHTPCPRLSYLRITIRFERILRTLVCFNFVPSVEVQRVKAFIRDAISYELRTDAEIVGSLYGEISRVSWKFVGTLHLGPVPSDAVRRHLFRVISQLSYPWCSDFLV